MESLCDRECDGRTAKPGPPVCVGGGGAGDGEKGEGREICLVRDYDVGYQLVAVGRWCCYVCV